MFQTRKPILAGGFGDANPHDRRVIRAAKAALEAYKAKHGTLAALGIAFDKVTKAEMQIVAGWIYRLKFDAHLKMDFFSKYSCDALVTEDLDKVLSVTKVDCKYGIIF